MSDVAVGQVMSQVEAMAPPPTHRLPAGVAGAVGFAWAGLVVVQMVDPHPLDHDAIFETSRTPWLAAALFLVGWQLMVAAMMLPGSVPVIRAMARPPDLAAFLAGFAAVWTVFACCVLNLDSLVHRVVDHAPWLAARSHLVLAGLLLAVGAAEMTPLARRCLAACRHWERRHGRQALAEGVRYGTLCVGCDGPLMLLMFAVGKGNVAWMALLAALMTAARVEWMPRSTPRLIGAAALVSGTAVLAAALW